MIENIITLLYRKPLNEVYDKTNRIDSNSSMFVILRNIIWQDLYERYGDD